MNRFLQHPWLPPAALALAVAALSFAANDGGNRSPYFWHNDEPSKAAQLIEGYHNARHPVLLLETVRWTFPLPNTREPEDYQRVTLHGRTVSAVFVAAGTALLILAAWLVGSWWAAVPAAVFLLLLPPLVETARVFKEDSVLFFALALLLVAVRVYLLRPGLPSVLILGAAAGLASSSKYIGIVPALAALALPCIAQKHLRGSVLAFVTAVTTTVFLNIPLLRDAAKTARRVAEETSWLLGGHYGVGLEIPHAAYFRHLRETMPWPLLVLALLPVALSLPARNRAVLPLAVSLTAFIPATLLVLSFTGKYSERYLLPVEILILWLAAWGLALVVHHAASRLGWKTAALCGSAGLVAGAFPLIGPWQNLRAHYTWDDRTLLMDHVEKFDSPMKIAQDDMVGLPQPDKPEHRLYGRDWSGRPVSSSYFVADLGTLDGLRKKGFTHVAISWDVAHRYLEDHLQSATDLPETARRQRFYRELESKGELEWESTPNRPRALHPGLRLYRIDAPSGN